MVTKEWFTYSFGRCTTRRILNFIRLIYLVTATVIVGNGFYNSYNKMKEANVLVKEEIHVLDKMRYPSITFCYKYKHGSKLALTNYYPSLLKKGRHKGKAIQ